MKKIYVLLLLAITCFRSYAQTDIISQAESFFKSFIKGDIETAYTYFDKEFTNKVSREAISEAQKAFLAKFGAFKEVSNVLKLSQNGSDVGVVSTDFEDAKPIFTIYFNQAGKIIGLFNTAENPKSKYKDPAYADASLYEEKFILIQTGDFKLPGVLTVPKTKAKFPVVVMVHGSGPNDKDESLESIKTFRDLALGLAAQGIASIRYDKRTKVYGINSAPKGQLLTVNEETTADAVSALKIAATVEGADPAKVFLVGHSLGAMMAPRIASMHPGIGGLIAVAAPARKLSESLADQLITCFPWKQQARL